MYKENKLKFVTVNWKFLSHFNTPGCYAANDSTVLFSTYTVEFKEIPIKTSPHIHTEVTVAVKFQN